MCKIRVIVDFISTWVYPVNPAPPVKKIHIRVHFWFLVARLKKRMNKVSIVSCFIARQMRTAAWKTAPQVALRNCSKEAGGEGQYICDFGKRGVDVFKHAHTHTYTHAHIYILLFFWSLCWSQETVITMKNVSAFLDMRRYKNEAQKISSRKYPTIWRLVLPLLVPNTKCLLLLSTLRGCWKSAAAAACDLILVEVDGKHPW